MHSIEKKDIHQALGFLETSFPLSSFRRQAQVPTHESGAQVALGRPVSVSEVRKVLDHIASKEAEVVAVALRHARMSSSLLDRVRGRYRQLLVPLQLEARRALQFLSLQVLLQSCRQVQTTEAVEATVLELYGGPIEILRERLADYFAHPDAAGEVFARNVWEVIQGPREGERFAVFALRMNSLFRRLSVSFHPSLENFSSTPPSLLPRVGQKAGE